MRTKNKSALLTVLTLTVALSVMPANAQAQSQAGTSAECSLSFPAYISPGLGLTPNSGHFNSAGETGSINCVGTIHGHTVTGPGSFGFDGTLTDSSCLFHQGSGTAFLTVPTDAGPLHISGGGFTVTGVGVFGTNQSTHDGGLQFDGSYVLLPTKGNCITEPLTEGRVLMNGSLRDVSNPEPSIKCDLDAIVVKVNCRSGS